MDAGGQSACMPNPTAPHNMNARRNPHDMYRYQYRYYGAPAVALRDGGLGAGEASQAPAVSAGTGALTAYDLVSALAVSNPKPDTQVAAAEAPNGMPPAAAATVMHHSELNAHFSHPLPRKFVKKIPKVVQPVICEVCKIQLCGIVDLKAHEKGIKHKWNLEKLQDLITPKEENPPNGDLGTSTAPAAAVADGVMSAVQPKKNKRSAETPEDLEMKKRRVLETGAGQGELKICTVSNVVKKIPKVVQPVICEVCKIQLCGIVDLKAHEIGKKHRWNLEKLQDSIMPKEENPPNGSLGTSTAPAAAVADGVMSAVQPKKNKRSAETPEDPEMKKRRLLEAGAGQGELKICTVSNVVKKIPKVVKVVTCEVCKIQCPLDNLRIHEIGKKHKRNLEKSQDSITPKEENPPNGALGTSTAPAAAVADGVISAVQSKKNKEYAETPEDLEMKKRRPIALGTAQDKLKKICTVCNFVAGSQKHYDIHIAGRKHKAKLQKQQQAQLPHVSCGEELGTAQDKLHVCTMCNFSAGTQKYYDIHIAGRKHKAKAKLQGSITPKEENPPNGALGTRTAPAAAVADGVISAVQSKKNKEYAETPEDLEMKKRRLIALGTAQDKLKKICTVCNVVAGSQKHYDIHIAGRKHKAKLQKQQQAQLLHVACDEELGTAQDKL